jgi:iron(III) transport system substrate-binding protein
MRHTLVKKPLLAVLALVTSMFLSSCSTGEPNPNPTASETIQQKSSLVLYSGRSEELIQPLIEVFEEETGIATEVRYAGSAELAAQILEEGQNSPADVFFSQDAGALGAISKAGLLEVIPSELTSLVASEYSATDKTWVGVSGRARVLVYNPAKVSSLPSSVFDLAKPEWKGKIAIAPTNASFQAFVTAMRVVSGGKKTSDWLLAMKTNAVVYEKNDAILAAVEAGQVDAGLINHYYWFAKAKEIGLTKMKSKLAAFDKSDLGNLVNVAGVGIINDNSASREFVKFLLSAKAQNYFAEVTAEYPLLEGIEIVQGLTPLVDLSKPEIDLSDLDSLDETLEMIRAAGLI